MPQILNKNKHNRKRNKQSPAMEIGLTNEILTFEKFFDLRRSPDQFNLDEVEQEMFFDTWKYARRKIRSYK